MPTTEPKKVFIVDDDEMLRTALQDYLSRKGDYAVSVFETGEECMQHLNERPYAVILDYYLNSIHKDAANGLDVLKQIKSQEDHIHVIMLSNQESYGTALQTIQKGAEQYVIKDESSFQNISEILSSLGR